LASQPKAILRRFLVLGAAIVVLAIAARWQLPKPHKRPGAEQLRKVFGYLAEVEAIGEPCFKEKKSRNRCFCRHEKEVRAWLDKGEAALKEYPGIEPERLHLEIQGKTYEMKGSEFSDLQKFHCP
jgi:hypothetical protein